MADYAPKPHLRQERITNPKEACLLFIDTQNYNCRRNGAIYKSVASASAGRAEDEGISYFFSRLETTCIPTWIRMQELCRTAGIEVIYTVIQSLTADGRDRSRDYVISGFHVPPGSWDAQVIAQLAPAADEMVLPKTSSSVFNSTNIDYILRSMGKRHLLLAGCVTDQCVAHAVMDACDLGYAVTMVPDATATYNEVRQHAALSAVRGYCRMVDMAYLEEELGALVGRGVEEGVGAAEGEGPGQGEKPAEGAEEGEGEGEMVEEGQ